MLITENVKKISNLPAGRELDRRVAKAIGWKCPNPRCKAPTGTCEQVPLYSTDTNAAIKLRIEMEKLGWESEDQYSNTGWSGTAFGYSVWFKQWEMPFNGVQYVSHNSGHPGHDKMALVTARAALLALEEKEACRSGPSKEAMEQMKKAL